MAIIDAVLSYSPLLLFVYLAYRSYENDGIAKAVIKRFTEWIETGKVK